MGRVPSRGTRVQRAVPGWETPVEFNADSAVSRYRSASAQVLEGLPAPRSFQNPEEGSSVLASEFLVHLNLDRPGIHAVLEEAYPYIDDVPGLKGEVHARVRFVAWMTLKGFNQLAPAFRLLRLDPAAQHLLGFHKGVPCYDTLREFVNERLAECRHDRLLAELLVEQRRLLSTLGHAQVQDATPLEARRREVEAPYNPHYKVRMMKLELRWDPAHEALLTQRAYDGLMGESPWLAVLTNQLRSLGVHGTLLTVDGGYTSFQHIALQWRHAQPLHYRTQQAWNVNREEAERDVLKRYQTHRRNPKFLVNASLPAKIRFLIDHGTPQDVEAAGKYLRDDYVSKQPPEENGFVRAQRSMNEALNGELKRLPIAPARRGTRELLRRSQACTLTLHLVQLTRLQHGITTHLSRTANLL